MSEQNINGLTTYLPKQPEEKNYQQFNGIHSSQSSRSSSPMVRPGQIPSSQLPANMSIPQSQLPPSRPSLATSSNQQFRSLGVEQNITGSKLSMNALNAQSSPTFLPSTGLGIMSVVSNSSVQSESSSLKNNVTSAVPNLKPSQLPQNLSSNMKETNSNPQLFSQSNLHQRTNNNGPALQNSQLNSMHPIPSNSSGEQKLDNQLQFKTTYSQNQQNVILPNYPQHHIMSQSTTQSPNFHNANQNDSNQRAATLNQSNLSSNVSHFPGNLQSNPPPYNAQLSSAQNSLSSLNLTTANNSVSSSSFQPRIAPNNLRPIAPSNSQSFPQNTFRQQTQHSVIPPPSIFQPNTNNTQTNYNGPPTRPLLSSFPTVNQKSNLLSNRYPTSASSTPPTQFGNQQYSNSFEQQHGQPEQQFAKPQYPYQQNTKLQYPGSDVVQGGFNKLWGTESIDLLQTPNILPPTKVEAPKVVLGNDILDQANCSPDIFRCTISKIPENNTLLQKSRLPLGVLIHPFRDLHHLPVIQCNVIVRCRACRTYINPFVMFVDNKRWKCNLCYRINELPEEFQYDPVTKTYGDPSRRPEIKSSTLEYIAPAEYMLRPPQPAVYLFLLDVSRLAIESGYLDIVSKMLLEELNNLPGDARTQIGFVGYDSAIHFYSLPDCTTQPHEMTVLDVDEIFLPTPDNLLVNLKDRMDLIRDLLAQLPSRYANTYDTNSALGAALQVAYKMISATGGRVTVFQAALPNIGPGALTAREDPSQRVATEVAHLNPANDFYKRLALECSGQQIAVDLFLVNSQYLDIATISGISRFSGGCIHHFPLLRPTKTSQCESFARCFRRYLTRKIGFEAVMRIRCTRGLSIHTFHGNFFVRSTDLLSLPNINPDSGFGMQVAIEESLADVQTVCFQAALLYTSSKGERRIRVHTMCLPVASTLHDIIHSADQQCIVGVLSKMAVDRSMQSSLSDAREAFINVAIDILSSFKMSLNLGSPVSGLLVPNSLKLLSLYISALLKHKAFRVGSSTRLDDRVMAMIDMKTKPLYLLMQQIYPDMYPIHELENQQIIINSEEESVPMPPRLQLTARCLENKGAFLLDLGEHMIILVCPNVSLEFLNEALGVQYYNALPEEMFEIPLLDNIRNQRLHQFINYLNEDKPFVSTVQVIRDNSNNRAVFFERLIEDRMENALSYHEFLQHLKTQVK